MEREILFRAKRKDNGEWIESLTLFKLDEHLYMFQTAWGEITYDLQYNITAIRGKKPFLVEVIPETVGRYTGLTDKNGRKIFEEDIVKTKYGRRCKVIWFASPCFQGFDLRPIEDRQSSPDKFDLYASNNLEVIGNIYDNSELMKGETNV